MAFSQETKQARSFALVDSVNVAACYALNIPPSAAPLVTAGRWHAHHKTAEASGGSDSLSNCEALCIPAMSKPRLTGLN